MEQAAAETPSDPITTRRGRGRRAFIYLAVAAVVAVGGYLLYRWWTGGTTETDNAQIDAETVPISARVGGIVVAVHVRDHDRVKEGAPLLDLDLDTAELDAKVRQVAAELAAARAQLASAKAQLEIVKASSSGGMQSATAQLDASGANVRAADAQIAAAAANVARAKAEHDRAKTDLERAKRLRNEGAIPGTALEQAQASFDTTRAALDQAAAQLAAAREQRRLSTARVAEARAHVVQSAPVDAQVGGAAAAVELATANVARAEAALDRARIDRQHANVTAPVAGRVSRVSAHVGQTMAVGHPFVVLVPDEMFVIANIKESDVDRVRPGQRAEIEIDAFPDLELEGTVESISPATGARFSLIPPDNATGNFVKVVQRVPVRIKLASVQHDLRAGLSAEVTIHVP